MWAKLAVLGTPASTVGPLTPSASILPLPDPKRQALPPLCCPENLPQVAWGVTCNQSADELLSALLGFAGSLSLVTSNPTRELKGLVLQTQVQRVHWTESIPVSHVQGEGCVVGRKGHSRRRLVCSKPAFLTNSCVYTKLEARERDTRERTLS